MINAGKEFKRAFSILLNTVGGNVVLIRNFNCSNTELIELRGVKNSEKGNPSDHIFQFTDKLEVSNGDVIQQKGSTDYWKIWKTEDRIIGDEYICFIAHVKRIDLNGKPLD